MPVTASLPSPMTTTAGATSEPETPPGISHTADLVERHRITIPVGATGDNVAVARLHAQAYARAHGFELKPGSFHVIAANAAAKPSDPGWLGVAFDVMVGKGDIALDQRVPGVLDRWTWSGPRVEWWRRIFNRADGRQGRVLAAREENGRVLRGPWRGPDALHGFDPAQRADGQARCLTDAEAEAEVDRIAAVETARPMAGTGCTCALGGPFRDICPVHYKPGSNT